MRSRPTCTTRDLGELINALPAMFGFPPHDSLVALGLDGKRVGFGMRLDLADAGDIDDVADHVVGHLQKQGASGAIVLAVGEPLDRGRQLVIAVERRLFARRDGTGRRLTVRPVAGGWATDDRFWLTMAGSDADGYAYRRSIDHPISLQAISEGQEILGSRVELTAKLEPFDGIRRRWLDASAASVEAEHEGRSDVEVCDEILPIVHDLYAGRDVSDGRVLRAGHAITRIDVRDAAWNLITPDNAREMVRVWVHVARTVPEGWAPPALSLVAFAAWMRGDGAFAVTAAQRALDLDAGYSMARLMLSLATSGISPDHWARPGAPRR